MLLNLMPTKIVTETRILRKLSNTPLQIEVELLQTISHDAKNVSVEHLSMFYRSFEQVERERFDGMIITGAPVELLDFEHVDYWDELCRIMEWSRSNVHSTLHICWGAQAAIYYHYGIPKYELPEKLFGVFEHNVVKPSSPLVRGFNDVFRAPHSRYTEVRAKDIEAHPSLSRHSHIARKRASILRKAPTAATSSCSATPNTTRTRCSWNTSATLHVALISSCPRTTSPETTPPRSPVPHGGRMRSCSTPTG